MADWLVTTLTHLASPWAYLLVGVLATVEAVFVGLVLPGEFALLLGGFLAFAGHVSLVIMLVVAIVAAIAGYLLGYGLGRRLGPALRTSRIGRRIGPARWKRVDTTLATYGGQALLVGGLIGVLRAVLPTAAGMARMPFATFLIYTVAGGVLWGPGFVLLGYLAGRSCRRVADIAGSASAALLIVLLLVVVVIVLARRAKARRQGRGQR